MSNMSYCRFQNTLNDLDDCYNNIDDDDLSIDEERARIKVIRLCIDIADDYRYEVEVFEQVYIVSIGRYGLHVFSNGFYCWVY